MVHPPLPLSLRARSRMCSRAVGPPRAAASAAMAGARHQWRGSKGIMYAGQRSRWQVVSRCGFDSSGAAGVNKGRVQLLAAAAAAATR
eukprot:1661998-Pyramimonas_sp.AAC.1